MNYTTTLLIFALLSRLIFCSTPKYRAVCATEYSSVFWNVSTTQLLISIIAFRRGILAKEFMNCLENKEKAKEHYRKIPIELKSDSKSNTEMFDSIHENVCEEIE